MQVNFTRHALKRMGERRITDTEVLNTLQHPDAQSIRYDTLLALRQRKDGYWLVVVYTESDNIKKVITVIITSKIHKYLSL